MAPQDVKSVSKVKCLQEKSDEKQKLFSFRSLLKKSKSSRSSKEMIQTDKSTLMASKSCDFRLSALESVDRCPTFLLWKLLPPSSKMLNRYSIHDEKMRFRTSFSCSDMCSMVPPRLQSSDCGCLAARLHKSIADVSGVSKYSMFKSEEYQNVLCKLCLTMVPASDMHTLRDCNCVFCIPCLQQYLIINIREGNVIVTCPDAECFVDGKILVSEIREIAGEEVFYMFERYRLNLEVELDPKRVWCPSAGCETVCSFQPSSDPDRGVSVLCLSCRTRFCSMCKLGWHRNISCEDARKHSNDQIELSMSDEESLIKRCPSCRIPIEKDEGCAQMMCYRCKHVFCWHCLASLDDDFLLRHYDKGPCRNKLGHSRASMMWHRTQVVGIFAGFSFLLLMASPFLLLAAPCFFCCRCKNKFFYEETTPL